MVRQFEETRRAHLAIALSTNTDEYASEDDFELAVSVAASIGLAGHQGAAQPVHPDPAGPAAQRNRPQHAGRHDPDRGPAAAHDRRRRWPARPPTHVPNASVFFLVTGASPRPPSCARRVQHGAPRRPGLRHPLRPRPRGRAGHHRRPDRGLARRPGGPGHGPEEGGRMNGSSNARPARSLPGRRRAAKARAGLPAAGHAPATPGLAARSRPTPPRAASWCCCWAWACSASRTSSAATAATCWPASAASSLGLRWRWPAPATGGAVWPRPPPGLVRLPASSAAPSPRPPRPSPGSCQSLDALRILLTGLVTAWKDILTVAAPVGVNGGMLVAPVPRRADPALLAGLLAWRVRRPYWTALPVTGVFRCRHRCSAPRTPRRCRCCAACCWSWQPSPGWPGAATGRGVRGTGAAADTTTVADPAAHRGVAVAPGRHGRRRAGRGRAADRAAVPAADGEGQERKVLRDVVVPPIESVRLPEPADEFPPVREGPARGVAVHGGGAAGGPAGAVGRAGCLRRHGLQREPARAAATSRRWATPALWGTLTGDGDGSWTSPSRTTAASGCPPAADSTAWRWTAHGPSELARSLYYNDGIEDRAVHHAPAAGTPTRRRSSFPGRCGRRPSWPSTTSRRPSCRNRPGCRTSSRTRRTSWWATGQPDRAGPPAGADPARVRFLLQRQGRRGTSLSGHTPGASPSCWMPSSGSATTSSTPSPWP